MSARDELFARLWTAPPGQAWVGSDPHVERYATSPIERYIELAQEQLTTVARVGDLAQVPAEVARYMAAAALDPRIWVACDDWLEWSWHAAGLKPYTARSATDGEVRIAPALAAIGENGALVLSSALSSIAEDFLARTHIAVLSAEDVLPDLPALWARIRDGSLPREFCLVTGPSRTADLGVPAKMGAHGPAQVHVILVG